VSDTVIAIKEILLIDIIYRFDKKLEGEKKLRGVKRKVSFARNIWVLGKLSLFSFSLMPTSDRLRRSAKQLWHWFLS